MGVYQPVAVDAWSANAGALAGAAYAAYRVVGGSLETAGVGATTHTDERRGRELFAGIAGAWVRSRSSRTM